MFLRNQLFSPYDAFKKYLTKEVEIWRNVSNKAEAKCNFKYFAK